MPTILRYEDYTIGWICALPVEVLAALFMLDEEHEGVFPARAGDDNDYIPGAIGGHNVVIVGLPKKSTGTVSAASLVSQMRQSFPKLRYGLMVGIGAGVPGRNLQPDVRLGDVVVGSPPDGSDDAQGVIGYELGKETVEGFVRKNWLCPTDRRFRTALDSIQTQARLRGSYTFVQHLEAFKKRESGNEFFFPATSKDYLYEANCEKGSGPPRIVPREPRNSRDPVVHYGLIASGDKLIKNAKLRDALRDKYNIVCFEMETAGLLNILPVAVIRGVCDYADTHKNDEWHGYAAATAAAFAKGLLYKIGPEVASDYNQSLPTSRTTGQFF
ncbi:nucleoside phosphorylase domain-containing protein [Tricladium varicosporioides]|nr:nucleoside phosphorylase domain-containing protein [Hymenoscyphus varicosporioides]